VKKVPRNNIYLESGDNVLLYGTFSGLEVAKLLMYHIFSESGEHILSHCSTFRPEVTFFMNLEVQKVHYNHTFLESVDQLLSNSLFLVFLVFSDINVDS
jgi:hypothetical protein